MSEPTRILLVGATGMIGQAVIARAVGREDLRILALSRREFPLPRGARMEVMLAQTPGWDEAIAAIAPDHVICALGTTRRKEGGDIEAMAAVDRDLVLRVAEQAKLSGTRGFTVISSVGADLASRHDYLRIKGEMEKALMKMGFTRLDVFRPGLLKGARQDDLRPLEKIAMLASPLINLFLTGERSKYRAIAATDVAAAALQTAREKAPGRFAYHNDGILRLAGKLPGV